MSKESKHVNTIVHSDKSQGALLGGLLLDIVVPWDSTPSFRDLRDILDLIDLRGLCATDGVAVGGGAGGATGVAVRCARVVVVLLLGPLALERVVLADELFMPMRGGVGPAPLRCSSRPRLLG